MASSRHRSLAAFFAFASLSAPAHAAPPAAAPPAKPKPDWVARSDEHAKVPLGVMARFTPEFAGFVGVEGLDREVLDLKPGLDERQEQASRQAVAELEARLAAEKDPRVRQDLEIMIANGRDSLEGAALNRKYLLPYFDAPQTIFQGLQALLDEQVPAARRALALVRLKRYVGLEPGYTPVLELARDRVRERLSNPSLLGPARAELEKNLGTARFYVDGVAKLFAQIQGSGLRGAARPAEAAGRGLRRFLRKELLPRARTTSALPPGALRLLAAAVRRGRPPRRAGRTRAGVVHGDPQRDADAGADGGARRRSLSATDYRDGHPRAEAAAARGRRHPAALPAAAGRAGGDHPARASRHPAARPARIRIASEAESAATPAPNMRAAAPDRQHGRAGRVHPAPQRAHAAAGAGAPLARIDDFTFHAASWTLTVHEGRPGHEMQFAALVENGVSVARAAVRVQQRQRGGLGALYGGGDEAVPAPRWPAHRAPAPDDARGPRLPRPRPPGRAASRRRPPSGS